MSQWLKISTKGQGWLCCDLVFSIRVLRNVLEWLKTYFMTRYICVSLNLCILKGIILKSWFSITFEAKVSIFARYGKPYNTTTKDKYLRSMLTFGGSAKDVAAINIIENIFLSSHRANWTQI